MRREDSGPSAGAEVRTEKELRRFGMQWLLNQLAGVFGITPRRNRHHAVANSKTDPPEEPLHVVKVGGDSSAVLTYALRFVLITGNDRSDAECTRLVTRAAGDSNAGPKLKWPQFLRLHDN